MRRQSGMYCPECQTFVTTELDISRPNVDYINGTITGTMEVRQVCPKCANDLAQATVGIMIDDLADSEEHTRHKCSGQFVPVRAWGEFLERSGAAFVLEVYAALGCEECSGYLEVSETIELTSADFDLLA